MANQLTDPNEGFKKTERIPQWTRHISWVAVAAPGPTTGGQSPAPARGRIQRQVRCSQDPNPMGAAGLVDDEMKKWERNKYIEKF